MSESGPASTGDVVKAGALPRPSQNADQQQAASAKGPVTRDIDPVSITLAAVIGVVAFATSFGHVEHVAAAHGWRGSTAWAPPVVTELLASASAANIRWRMRAGASMVLPVGGVLLGLVVSVSANLATADDGVGPTFARLPWGTILGVLMPSAFLLSLMMIEPMIARHPKPAHQDPNDTQDRTESVTTTVTETEEFRTQFAAFRAGELPHAEASRTNGPHAGTRAELPHTDTSRTAFPHGSHRAELPHADSFRTGLPHGADRAELEARTEPAPHDLLAAAFELLGGSLDTEDITVPSNDTDSVTAVPDTGETPGQGPYDDSDTPVDAIEIPAQAAATAPAVLSGQVVFTAPPADFREERFIDDDVFDAEAPRAQSAYGATRTRTVRTEQVRTTRTPAPRTDTDSAERAEFVRTLAARIRTEANWRPDYDALQAESGFRRRWCEKAVADARAMAADGVPH